jgi:hypothetical protein
MRDGGGGLSTIWGLGLIKREKKPGHIYSDSCLYLLIGFDLLSLIGGGVAGSYGSKTKQEK